MSANNSVSSSSVPASDEAIDEMEDVQRAITAAAATSSSLAAAGDSLIGSSRRRSSEEDNDTASDDFLTGAARSGDSPPPPERKLNTSKNNHSAIPPAPAAPPPAPISSPGKNRFQFYVPAADYAAIGGTINSIDILPDPPSAAEESARKARSRLIQLQNSLGVGKAKRPSFSSSSSSSTGTGDGGGGTCPTSSSAAAVQNDNKVDEDEEEEDDYPQMNFDPIESDDEVNSIDTTHLVIDDDDDDDDDDEEDSINSSTEPQQLVGRGTFSQQQQQQQETQLHHSSPQLLAKEKNMRRQSTDLYSDGIDLLETAANEARERDELDTLNDSITYLRNLQLSGHSQSSADTTTTTTPRKAAPLPPPPLYGTTITRVDNADDIVEFRARSNSLDGDSPNNKTGIISSSKTTVTSSTQNHHHHRPLPPPPQRQQYRQAQSVPSTPSDSKRSRPKITAAEAMDFVINASTARVQKYNEDNNNNNDGNDNEGDKAVDRMNAFLGTINRGDELPPRDDDNVDKMELLASRSGGSSFQTNNYGESSSNEIHDDDDDFEQNTSLSMHAEAKSPSTTSRYAENKHRSILDSAKNQLDRLTFHDHRPKPSLLDNRQNSLLLDEEQHDSAPPRRTSSIDPPDLEEFGLTTSNSSINPSVLPLQTMNERLYGVEAVIPSSSPEHGFSRQSSKEARAHLTALGPRSKRPGGITGVVLDVGSNESEQYRPQVAKGRTPTSSYGGSGSRGMDPQDTVVDSTRSQKCDTERLLSKEDFRDGQSISQMTSLCSHLLPIGFNSFFRNDNGNDVNLSWDDEDPDESGYIVHRLTDSQLINVENAFEKMVNSFEQSSANKVRTGANDKNFERDLKEAEIILDQEEERNEAEVKAARYSAAVSSSDEDSDASSKSDVVLSQLGSSPSLEGVLAENEDRTCVPDFPGIFSPGQGRVGEMECFFLPIITKSQKTGFEPTKDLVLKPGSVFANNYLVQCELGSAAFSTAYRCIDLSSEEDEEGYQDEVCLKVIKNTKDYFDQSIDEIKILQLLKDTGRVEENNIVEMKSFFYHREHLVIVTELLRQNLYEFGNSIRESRGPVYFTRRRLSHITRQCLIALKFVHEIGLMHCDIKPEVSVCAHLHFIYVDLFIYFLFSYTIGCFGFIIR